MHDLTSARRVVSDIERDTYLHRGVVTCAQHINVQLVGLRKGIVEHRTLRRNELRASRRRGTSSAKKEQLYWSSLIASNSSSSRKLWQDLNLLTRKSDDLQMVHSRLRPFRSILLIRQSKLGKLSVMRITQIFLLTLDTLSMISTKEI